MTSKSRRIHYVQPGSPVSAANTNRPTRELEQRVHSVEELLSLLSSGHVLVREDQPVSEDVLPGYAVYWNAETGRFEPALAAVAPDTAGGALQPAPSADCLGVCLKKPSSTTATIGLVGLMYLDAEAIQNLILGDPLPGRYYLSATTPGKAVQQRPPITVAVGYLLVGPSGCDTGGWFFVNPQMRDFLEDHIHYRVPLIARPAGDHQPPLPGDPHQILNPDPTKPGWLPADHAVFGGTAPAGAVFGYNLPQHPELEAIWPPIPEEAVVLEVRKPTGADFTGFVRVPDAYFKVTRHGLWWMTDCYDNVPWPTDLDTLASASSASASACPPQQFEMLVSFARMTFATDRSVVTSLQPAEGAPLRFQDADGNPANTGHLYADLDAQFLIDEEDVPGGQVFKEVVDGQLALRRGWVTEGLIAGSSSVILSGTHSRPLDSTDPESPTVHQGIVTVSLQSDFSGLELAPQIVQLEDALERMYKNLVYLALPDGRDSAVRFRYSIPHGNLPQNLQMVIRAYAFGRAEGPWSAVNLRYQRITVPQSGAPVPLDGTETAVNFDVVTPSDNYDGNGTNLPADNVITVDSDPIPVTPGDTLFVVLERKADAVPLFAAEIGLLRVSGILSPVV